MKRITSTEANRSFSKILASVIKGETAEITVRGEAVVKMERISPIQKKRDAEKQRQWDAFITRLREQPVLNIPRGTRDELYNE
jgi:antitoxin (DNA-binding transcriptional repressor) of toxin-antitoxin stability system